MGFGGQAQANVTYRIVTTNSYDFPASEPTSVNRQYEHVEGRCPTPEEIAASTKTSCYDSCTFSSDQCCFSYDTRIVMADGSTKKIGEITVGEETAYGIVNQTHLHRFDQSRAATQDFQIVYRGGLYEWQGILVTGNHILNHGNRWLAIAELADVRPVFAPHIENVYNLDVEGGIIPVITSEGGMVPFLDNNQFLTEKHLAA